jgi:1-acyl-sn-glycerol-3-phosphate acyltransferase
LQEEKPEENLALLPPPKKLSISSGDILRLERKLYEHLLKRGIISFPPPPSSLPEEDPSSHKEWLQKGIQSASSRQSLSLLKKVLSDLSPAHLTVHLATLNLTPPEGFTDPFGMDPSLYERIRPWVRFLFEEYFRVEVDGVEEIPSRGAGILVANHGGILPLDALMIRYAVEEFHSSGRTPRFLIEDWFMRLPFVGVFLTRLGALRGSPHNARILLERGDLVGIFPEGAKGVGKTFRHRYRLQRFGRGGTIRLAYEMDLPIYPVAVLGSEEVHPVLFRISLPLRPWGIPFFPITPFFPLLGPLGLFFLPSKWHIRFLPPVYVRERIGPRPDEGKIYRLNEEIRERIQKTIYELYSRRRAIWFG